MCFVGSLGNYPVSSDSSDIVLSCELYEVSDLNAHIVLLRSGDILDLYCDVSLSYNFSRM